VSVELTILGSGSSGNAAFLESGDTKILIDAGLSGKQIRERLLKIRRSPEDLTAILISHEHTDHIQGLAIIAARLGIPVYATKNTCQYIRDYFPDEKFDFRVFQSGASIEIEDFGIDVFAVPHDGLDPVGFAIHTNDGKIGYVTDIGCVTRLVVERVRSSHILVIEANHDVQMLQNDPYRPWSLKQRILSRHGHLSNESAAELVEQAVSAELQYLTLAHLSRECNKPDIALNVMKKKLKEIGISSISVACASQTQIASTVKLKNGAVITGNGI